MTILKSPGGKKEMPTQPFSDPIAAEPSPFRLDEGGVVRIGTSRITLDLVIEQYENGMTPEEMVRAYDTLQLADAYAAIAYYLRHREEVRAYLTRRELLAGELKSQVEASRTLPSREVLLQRRANRETSHRLPRG